MSQDDELFGVLSHDDDAPLRISDQITHRRVGAHDSDVDEDVPTELCLSSQKCREARQCRSNRLRSGRCHDDSHPAAQSMRNRFEQMARVVLGCSRRVEIDQ